MLVYIINVDGKSHPTTVEHDSIVEDLYEGIGHGLCLTFQGEPLDNMSASIADIGIGSESSLYIERRYYIAYPSDRDVILYVIDMIEKKVVCIDSRDKVTNIDERILDEYEIKDSDEVKFIEMNDYMPLVLNDSFSGYRHFITFYIPYDENFTRNNLIQYLTKYPLLRSFINSISISVMINTITYNIPISWKELFKLPTDKSFKLLSDYTCLGRKKIIMSLIDTDHKTHLVGFGFR